MKMDWIFDGIGTAIITFILGLLGGGIAGYKIGVHKKTNIKIKTGKNSTNITTESGDISKIKIEK